MRLSFLLSVMVLCALLLCAQAATKQTPVKERRRRSKEIEDKLSKLDESTKKRIHAMKAAGMPKSAIAEKIAYETGGKNTAKRIVDALHDEPVPKKYVPPGKAGPAKVPPKASPAPPKASPASSKTTTTATKATSDSGAAAAANARTAASKPGPTGANNGRGKSSPAGNVPPPKNVPGGMRNSKNAQGQRK